MLFLSCTSRFYFLLKICLFKVCQIGLWTDFNFFFDSLIKLRPICHYFIIREIGCYKKIFDVYHV